LNVAGYFFEYLQVDSGYHLALAYVRGELLEQLEVGKTKPDRLYPAKNLMPTRHGDILGLVQNKLVRPY